MECDLCLFSQDSFPGLTFDKTGLCHSCQAYFSHLPTRTMPKSAGEEYLRNLCESIRTSKPSSTEYDCIIGLSGGVDSSYLAMWAKDSGLNPLAVHLDNGWNSDEATHNIMTLVETLGLDLHTKVLDWEEFRELQVAFLRASVPDVEIPTDHAIQATLWQTADSNNIKWILSGMNYRTESPTSPESWSYGHSDWKYIHSVNKRFGKMKLSTYPHYSLTNLFYWSLIKRIRIVSPLNYMHYSKDEAIKSLQTRVGWRKYGDKHHESVYTAFVQSKLLPEKFHIDKRIAHYSDLIRSKQISKEDAILELKKTKSVDETYVIKKLKISEVEFRDIMTKTVSSYADFPNNRNAYIKIKKLINVARKINIYPK